MAKATLAAVNVMELAGRMSIDVASTLRNASKKILYGEEGWEGDAQALQILQSAQANGGSYGHFSRSKRQQKDLH